MTSQASSDQLLHVYRWRALALQRMPYFAAILFRMTFMDNPGSGTFAVDTAWRCYIDFEAVVPYGDLWCSEALLHEAMHLYSAHAARATDTSVTKPDGTFLSAAHAKISNIAADIEGNDDLLAAGCTTLGPAGDPATGGPGGLVPATYSLPDNETYEFYLRELLKKAKPDQGGAGQGQGGTGQVAGGCGSGSGNMPISGEVGPDSEAPGMSATDIEAALIAAAVDTQEAAKSRGDVPAGLLATAGKHLAPSVIPWQQVLRTMVRRGATRRPGDTDYTYVKPNRRRSQIFVAPGVRAIFPGTFSPSPSVAVVRDTSGSMSGTELAMVTTEIEAISRKLGIKGEDLRVIDVDAKAYGAVKYTGVKSIEKIKGRGGTNMCVGIEAAAELPRTPNVCVVITDGYTPWPSAPVRRGMKVVACIVGVEASDPVVASVPPWIRTVTVPARSPSFREGSSLPVLVSEGSCRTWLVESVVHGIGFTAPNAVLPTPPSQQLCPKIPAEATALPSPGHSVSVNDQGEEVLKVTAIPIWAAPIQGLVNPWAVPYERYLPERAHRSVVWPLLHRLFELPSPYEFRPVSLPSPGGSNNSRCRRYLRTCKDYAQLSIHAHDTGISIHAARAEGPATVTSSMPPIELIRSASVTFRLLYSSEESASFPKVNKIISQALHEAGDQAAIEAHKKWVDVHNKQLRKFPIRRLSEQLFYELRGAPAHAEKLPPVESPEAVIRRYMYGGTIHTNETHEAELPDETDEFWHPHGLVGYLQDMDQFGMFYLGYGEIVSRVAGLKLDGSG